MKFIFIIVLFFLFTDIISAQDSIQVLYGKATYYHRKFEGLKTSNGEKFTHKKYTCAHKTLPFNTFLKVTNINNDRSTVLRVNDRLPKKSKILLDLSYIAAKELDFIRKGTADIRVEIVDTSNLKNTMPGLFAEAAKGMKMRKIYKNNVINPTSEKQLDNTLVTAKNNNGIKTQNITDQKDTSSLSIITKSQISYISKKGYGIQVLSYNSSNKAQDIANKLTKKYNETVSVITKEIKGKTYYRVIIGDYNTKPELLAMKNILEKEYKDCYTMKLD